MIEWAKILKANPYHDELGRFSTKDKSKFVSVGEIFDKQRANAAGKAKPSDADSRTAEAMKELEKFVDFQAPFNRLKKINEGIEADNRAAEKAGLKTVALRVMPPDSVVEGVTNRELAEALSSKNVSIYSAMSMATVKKILAGDEFKNSLQAGKGTFSTIGEERAGHEREFLGVKADTSDPSGFPKYGFVSKKGEMSDSGIVGFGYGGVYVEFNDSVRKRTTITVGDSYNKNVSSKSMRMAAPIDAPSIDQLKDPSGSTQKLLSEGAKEFKKTKGFSELRNIKGTEYIEAQMYGAMDSKTIKAIHVESASDAKALATAIKKSGLDISIVPTKTHTRLQRLSEGYIEDWEKVSAQDLSDLGDAYVDKGWSTGTTGQNLFGANGWKKDLPKMNLPAIKKLIEKYPDGKGLTTEEKRAAMMEFMLEGAKGDASTLPKALRRKPTGVGFTKDVLNRDLLKEYV